MKSRRPRSKSPPGTDPEILVRDRTAQPLTRVHNLDDPRSKPRLVRLPPREAVLYCYAQYIGSTVLDIGELDLKKVDNGWILGPFYASADV